MPTDPTIRLIFEGEYARLKAGLTRGMVAKLIRKAEGTIAAYERNGACYGAAWLMHCATGARMEAYLHPRRVAVPIEEYTALKRAADENESRQAKGRSRVAPRRGQFKHDHRKDARA
jgi:hypothetical protein